MGDAFGQYKHSKLPKFGQFAKNRQYLRSFYQIQFLKSLAGPIMPSYIAANVVVRTQAIMALCKFIQ
jgi:hypothetical protein